MMIKYLQYRYVKARMTAYLDGELSTKQRRFIARQIDENPLCYRAYIAAKQTQQELERSLPTLGKPENGQLDAIWANIQSELAQPEPSAPLVPRPSYSLSYGLAMLIFALVVLTPFALDAGRTQLSPVPQHPFPEDVVQETSPAITPEADVQSIALAMDTAVQTDATDSARIPLQNTPAPRTPGS